MPKKVYVLESHWAWDNFNNEYATITLEGYESELEEVLKTNPASLKDQLDRLCHAQCRPVMGQARKVKLFRVVCPSDLSPNIAKSNSDGTVTLHAILTPICDFDDNGDPIPCEPVRARKEYFDDHCCDDH